MANTIELYLKDLKSALQGSDTALVQDALWDAETHLRAGVKAAQEKDPQLTEAQALDAVIQSFGSPVEVAEAYREREAVIETALRPKAAPQADGSEAPLSPWPGFFGVMATPKAYTSMLYLLMALPVGIFFFTWAAMGISLSFGLLFLIIGIPFAIAFLGSVRILALAEGRLVEALLDVRMPRRPSLLPEGKGWGQKLKNLLLDGHTWSSLAYMILHLPFGIFSFMVVVIGLSLSFGFIAAPITHFILGQPASIMLDGVAMAQPAWLLLLLPILGVLVFIATLHLSLAIGRLQGFIAKLMLVRR
jgi:hypothetical protein